jgi:hypothetical protein
MVLIPILIDQPKETIRSLTESKRLVKKYQNIGSIHSCAPSTCSRVYPDFSLATRYSLRLSMLWTEILHLQCYLVPVPLARYPVSYQHPQVLLTIPSLLFPASVVLREVYSRGKYYVLHFDLRIAGFADLSSLYTSLSQQMEQYFEEISNTMAGYKEFEKEAWGFKVCVDGFSSSGRCGQCSG